jgi:hypothetical protein
LNNNTSNKMRTLVILLAVAACFAQSPSTGSQTVDFLNGFYKGLRIPVSIPQMAHCLGSPQELM